MGPHQLLAMKMLFSFQNGQQQTGPGKDVG